MLNIYLGRKKYKDKIHTVVDRGFTLIHGTDCLEHPLCKEIIKEVDNTEFISPYSVISPVFGNVSMDWVSSGSKTLIVMLHETGEFYATWQLGDNCFGMLEKVTELVDVNLVFTNRARFTDTQKAYFPQYDVYATGDTEIFNVIKEHIKDYDA